jgi:adenylate cyclase
LFDLILGQTYNVVMPEEPAREVKVRYRKVLSFWMTFWVVFFLFVFSFFNIRAFHKLENMTIDFRFGLRGPREAQAPIKILAVDEKSLKEMGQWPWPRALHAQLIRELKKEGVKCIFDDFFFPEPERNQDKMLGQLEKVLNSTFQGFSEPEEAIQKRVLADVRRFQQAQNGDRDFSRALKETNNVFLPIVPFTSMDGRMPNPESLHATEAQIFGGFSNAVTAQSLIYSIPELQKNAKDAGHIRFFPDLDGVIRYVPTVIMYRGHGIPSLSLQISRYFLDDLQPVKVRAGEYVEVAGRKIPTLDNGFAFINFCGKSGPRNNPDPDGAKGTFDYVSASDVLMKRIEPNELKGTLVLLCQTAEGSKDFRPTPFTKASPGVEIHANVIENILNRNFISLAPEYLKFLLIFALGFLMWLMVPRLTPIQGTACFFLFFVGYVILAFVAFSYFNVIINLVYPSLSLLLSFLLLTTYKFATEVRHSRYLKQMFQSMVTPKVVEEILRLPAGIELGGEEKELTVLFSDVRGFTAFSEKNNPKEVVGILNEYLTQMTNLIFQTEGTLDKYVGDAVMAFWGAPTYQKDHAYRACSTALGMVDLLHAILHPKWEKEGKEKLQIGIGVNTGNMVVGFVGSEAIKNYTLIGDGVNLGSRLEGATKEYKVEIIINETTYEQVKNDMLCRELDLIRLMGKTKPIRIYELLDHRLKGAGNKEMKVKAFEEGLSRYRAQQWDEAEKRFKNCLDLDPNDGPAKIFFERCEELKANPPSSDWDGIFVMKTK